MAVRRLALNDVGPAGDDQVQPLAGFSLVDLGVRLKRRTTALGRRTIFFTRYLQNTYSQRFTAAAVSLGIVLKHSFA